MFSHISQHINGLNLLYLQVDRYLNNKQKLDKITSEYTYDKNCHN